MLCDRGEFSDESYPEHGSVRIFHRTPLIGAEGTVWVKVFIQGFPHSGVVR